MSIEKRKIDDNKQNPYASIAKSLGLLIVVFFLLFAAFFTWGAYNHMHSKEIDARLLDTVPDEFVIVTEEELNDYPELEEAIKIQSSIKTDPDEWLETLDFLKDKGSFVVKFEDEYYEIGFLTA
ncbi:hypothetical protein [Methanolobus profundi]|uniref:Uncharacterized protein n=1 Tax=Methanolobus profundi TaxID=487685 RepID=A0A1I4T511_9EURY|nr:hypothetical protein [Methanolobus profundi]SFM71731.1 hypothetical protein SAMN04488696_2194 [Methanolobus profundi]